MPYLPIDPQDIGCSYEAVIRVNSQSGKSGSAWLIEQNHGLKLPRALQQDFSQYVQQETDSHGKEMTHNALWQLFRSRYGLLAQPTLALLDYQSDGQQDGELTLQAALRMNGETRRLNGRGNGFVIRRRQRPERAVKTSFRYQGLPRAYPRGAQRQPLRCLYSLRLCQWRKSMGRRH